MYTNTIESFWANDYFGCSLSDLKNEKDIVCPHRYMASYNGLFIMKTHNKFIVSAPDEMVSELKQIANRSFDLFDVAVLQNHLSIGIESYIGPSWIGYLNNTKNIIQTNATLILSKTDELFSLVFDDLQKSCDEKEWSHSGIDENSEYIAIQKYDKRIVSAASYELWGDKIAHIGIITNPLHRNNGFASNVLISLTEFIIKKGLIPQYRTLCSNLPAIKTAEKCGFMEYASHISVRLK